ncbi:MAG: TIGR02300 family protein, partial [Acetobacteraceae bacterium]|nr:TIGR02300 family protein [Acetobacteraceae bacterium]
MAKPELGTKRLCASCGAKFYDLNKDPIVCPKCGTVYEVAVAAPRGRPDAGAARAAAPLPEAAELPETQEAEFVSLEEADAEAEGKKPGGEAVDDVEIEEVEGEE